jgi:hypothetical protein
MDDFGVPEQASLQKSHYLGPLTDVVSRMNSHLSTTKFGKRPETVVENQRINGETGRKS